MSRQTLNSTNTVEDKSVLYAQPLQQGIISFPHSELITIVKCEDL